MSKKQLFKKLILSGLVLSIPFSVSGYKEETDKSNEKDLLEISNLLLSELEEIEKDLNLITQWENILFENTDKFLEQINKDNFEIKKDKNKIISDIELLREYHIVLVEEYNKNFSQEILDEMIKNSNMISNLEKELNLIKIK